MEEKLNSLIEMLGNNKRNIIIAIVVYAIITIAVIVYIWVPKGNEYYTYQSVDLEEKKERLAQEYIDEVSLLFRTEDKNGIKGMLSQEYLDFMGKSADEIIEELESEGYFSLYAEVRGVSVYEDTYSYVYTTTIYSDNNSQTINIIERSPYEYKIAFGNFYSYSTEGNSYTSNDVKFTINSKYNNLRYIEYNIEIKNLNNVYASFNFNENSAIQAVLEDGTGYSLTNAISSEEYTKINTNTSIKKELVFEIPAQLQNSIKYIVFKNVKIDTATMDIKMEV